MDHFKVGFLGNERHLLHAMRAMLRYEHFSANEEAQYTFFLFGKFPEEILAEQKFNFQYMGEDREDLEAYADDYDLILDPERDFKGGTDFALSQWFEMKLNLECSKKSAPFIASWENFAIRATQFRLKCNTTQVGNTIFLMPPSPQDEHWSALPRTAGAWWAEAVEILDRAQYSIVYPQVKFKKYDYSFFFTGYEQVCNRCFMPNCTTLSELMYYLLHARMYIGCDNMIADLAAAVHIPSIILHARERQVNREIFSVRNDEYLLRPIYLGTAVRWDHAKLRSAVDHVESHLIPFSRSVDSYNRIRHLLGAGEAEG